MIEFSQKLLLKMNKAIPVKGHESSALIKINQAEIELNRGCLVYIFTFPKTPFFSCCVRSHSWKYILLPLSGAPYIFISTLMISLRASTVRRLTDGYFSLYLAALWT